MRAFTAEATFLDAAEGRDFCRDQAGVDADHAGLQRLGDAPDATEIAGIEIRREPEWRVVAHRDHIGFILEAEYRRERAKCFLVRDQRVGLDIGEHRRLEEAAAERMALAAGDDLRAALHGVLDMLFDLE